ncbi:MAG: beta-ketoacyl-[acyl-carrier-protein] synthase family protein [Sulfurimonas sp.]|nr:beta-ketoacyl-[acyl-carrier-protein] synthase family protein [Sulfurimonas sp.]
MKSACGDTVQTLDAIYNKKTSLEFYSDIVPEKTVCIGKFSDDKNFENLLDETVSEILLSSNLKDYTNTLLLVGSSVGGMAATEKVLFNENSYKNVNIKTHTINSIASVLDNKYNFLSTRSFSTACTSSANALKTAKELLQINAYENILVLGVDQICLTTIFGFNSLGILSDEVCTPFQNARKGMNVAEGIGALLLQNKKLENSIELVGAGTSSDAFHIANPDPTATGAISAITNALKDASLNSAQINYINAHGTGTNANDEIESKAVGEIFGEKTYISSSKSNIGHTLGAAGAIEAIICVESLKRGLLPPQIKCDSNESNLNFVSDAKKIEMNYALSNSFAFGGNNTSLIFGICNED